MLVLRKTVAELLFLRHNTDSNVNEKNIAVSHRCQIDI